MYRESRAGCQIFSFMSEVTSPTALLTVLVQIALLNYSIEGQEFLTLNTVCTLTVP